MFKSIYEFFFGPKIVYGEKHDSHMSIHDNNPDKIVYINGEKMIIFNPATQEFNYTSDDEDMPTGIPVIIMSNKSMEDMDSDDIMNIVKCSYNLGIKEGKKDNDKFK